MYAPLASPLPGLTVSPNGCRGCGMRGAFLGQDDGEGDPAISPDDSNITAPTYVLDTGTPIPEVISPMLPAPENLPPATIGPNFINVGGGNYLNTQTGQTVPQSIAEQVTAATTGAATANLQPTSTDVNTPLVAPTPAPSVSLNNLSAAAQALQATGQLVNSVGQLTAQGAALASSGNLYGTAAQASTTQGFSAAIQSLGTFLNSSSLIAGVPNWGVGVGLIVGLVVLSSMSGKKGRRR
jgi:hypothetical protein